MKYLPTIIITVLVLTAVLWPGSSLPEPGIPAIDKVVHICMFFAWTIAVIHDFNLKWYSALGAAIAFSLFTEVIQLGAEGRNFDAVDLVADTAGAVLGLACSTFVIRITKKVLRR